MRPSEDSTGHATECACPIGHDGLRQQWHLRNAAIAGGALAVWAASSVYGIDVPVAALLAGLGVLVLINIRIRQRLRFPRAVTEGEFLLPLVLDLAVLTYIFYLTGGAHNPFEGVFLVPVAITAAHLRWRHTRIMLAVTIACYTLLHFRHSHMLMADGTPVPPQLLQAGTYINYVVTAALVGMMVSSLAGAARRHATALAKAREQHLNDQFIVGFGALAAGAAHELATPLSVMTMLLKEMQNGRGSLKEDLEVLGGQVEACKQTLRHLSDVAGDARLDGNSTMPLDRFLASVADRFRQLRPGATLRAQWEGPNPAPMVRSDPALTQSLLNLLNNAADASDHPVEMRAYLRGDSLKMEVADRGEGIPTDIAANLGRPFVTGKPSGTGMGLGVFLTQSIIARLGGSMSYRPRPEGGTCVEVTLPMALLQGG